MRAKSLNDIHIQSSLMMKFNREHSGVLSRNYADMIIQASPQGEIGEGIKQVRSGSRREENGYLNMKAMKTKTKQSKQDRQANLMIAVAVITGVYFVVWALIGLIL